MKRKEKDANVEPQTKKVKKSVALEEAGSKSSNLNTRVKYKEKFNSDEGKKKEKKVNFEKPLTKKVDKRVKSKITDKSVTNNKNLKKIPNGNTVKEKPQVGVNSDNTSTEKPDWLKFKKEKKELKEARKAKRLTNVYDVSVKAKQLTEKLRRADCSAAERQKLTEKLHSLLQQNYERLIFTHDMSRVVQWLVRYCNLSIRKAIFAELKPSIIPILQSKYAKNCVRKILKYGSREVKAEVIAACYGNVVKLMTNMVSAPLIEHIYASHALDTEKYHFKQEFYGDVYKGAKDNSVKTLSDVFETATAMKPATLSALKANLVKILNKKIVSSTLVQTLVHEFFSHCTPEDRSELIVMLRNSMVELSRTKVGTKLAVACVWHGTNKDRKIMMKSLKEHVKALSTSQEGYLILLALLDSVDDTVLLRKIIISEMQSDFTEIVLNEYGRLVILYLIARRDPHYFPPSKVDFLNQGDSNLASKKPADVREKEIREAVGDALLDAVASNIATWMSSASVSMVTLAVLKIGTGEKLKLAFKSLAEYVTSANAKVKEGDVEHKLVEHAGCHMMLKKLVRNDAELAKGGETTFGEVLIDCLTETVAREWITFNRGCFLLVLLFENEPKAVVDRLYAILQPCKNELQAKSDSGAAILLKKINLHGKNL